MKQMKKIILILLICIVGYCTFDKIVFYNQSSQSTIVEKYSSSNQYIVQQNEALVSAHRSGGEIAPEETMLAFKNCVESTTFKADVFEFDLHITKDNVLVLLHDSTLDRTSDSELVFGEKFVKPSEKTYEELRQLNMGVNFKNNSKEKPYENLHGENVPDDLKILRVEDVLDYLITKGDYKYIIEIKDNKQLGFKAVDLLYKVLEERELLGSVIFGTFYSEVSEYVDKFYPKLTRSAGIDEVIDFYYKSLSGEEKLNVKYSVLQVPYKIAGFNLGTKSFVNYAHKNNIAVQYWTINDEKDVEYLNLIGADCIMSDNPEMAYKIINGD